MATRLEGRFGLASLESLRTAGCVLRFVALSVLLAGPGLGSLRGQVQVEFQNLAGVSPQVVEQASRLGKRTFSVAGIGSTWIEMGTAGDVANPSPRRVIRVRLVSARHSFSANPQTMGEALVTGGGGSLAVVYVDRVREFARKHRLPLATALAHAAAHEVGHLLLGNTVHSESGLMRASWNQHDADEMRSGSLVPDRESAEQMAAKLGASCFRIVALATGEEGRGYAAPMAP
jgi:hypothetical protein